MPQNVWAAIWTSTNSIIKDLKDNSVFKVFSDFKFLAYCLLSSR